MTDLQEYRNTQNSFSRALADQLAVSVTSGLMKLLNVVALLLLHPLVVVLIFEVEVEEVLLSAVLDE
jgi:hypothetical protein